MKLRNRPYLPIPAPRAGTTLSEVLISLLVMSIGIVSLATLFPISVLRSVQATQLTNSTNLRYNVEALVGALPKIYTVGSEWQPSYPYAQNAVVTPTQYSSLKYPPLVAICTTGGTSGTTEPNWLGVTPINDGGVQWNIVLVQNYIVDPQGEYSATYDDPNAMYRGPSAGPHFFGNAGVVNSAASPATSIRAFSGVNFQSTTYGSPSAYDDYMSADLACSPDSWLIRAESNSVTYSAGSTTCTLNDLREDLTQSLLVPTVNGSTTTVPPAFPPSRIVFYDVTGKISYVRPILSVSGSVPSQTIDWTMPSSVPPGGTLPTGALPATFTPVRARVEYSERRFSWLLSVRRGFSGTSSMDVVVFFRRRYSNKDEQVYPATFQTGAIDTTNSNAAAGTWAFYAADPGYDGKPGQAGIDDDGLNGTDDVAELGYAGSDDVPRNWVVIQYDDGPAAGGKPFYKKGGFVADATNLRWYRITDIIEGDVLNGYTPTAVMKKAGIDTTSPYYTPDAVYSTFASPKAVFLRLEKPIDQSGSVPSGGAGGVPTGGAIMMRGIVEVFPIRTQLSWEN